MAAPAWREEQWLDRASLRALQLRKFRALAPALAASPFYRAKFAAVGLSPERVTDWDAFRALPFTRKEELSADQEAHPPYGTVLTQPFERYTRLHQTSGTLGRPLRWLDTPESWAWFGRCWQAIYDATAITAADRMFFPFSFGPFIGFWAAFEGAQARGCLCLSGGGMRTEARVRALLEHRATVVCCTPTYALRMADEARRLGLDLPGSDVRALLVAGEPGGAIPTIRSRIETEWGARVFDHTGMTEIGSLGIECVEAPGRTMLLESECIAEAVDPADDTPVPTGAEGELVLTNLGRTGSPLVRYRTGDLVRLDDTPCACGRHFAQMVGGLLGRRDDMVIIRGNNVYPSVIEGILREHPEIEEYRLIVRRSRELAELTIQIELAPEHAAQAALVEKSVGARVASRYYYRPCVETVPHGTLPRFELKARRLIFAD
jgi:phenylacetate-CoA ligase